MAIVPPGSLCHFVYLWLLLLLCARAAVSWIRGRRARLFFCDRSEMAHINACSAAHSGYIASRLFVARAQNTHTHTQTHWTMLRTMLSEKTTTIAARRIQPQPNQQWLLL